MDVRTGSKSWGYSKRPRNWKKIMYKEIDEIDESHESEARIPEIDEIIPEIDRGLESKASIEEKPPKIGRGLESEARIEKPKITARVSKPLPRPLVNPASLTLHDPVLPATLVDPALPATLVDPALLDSSFSHI